MIDLMAIVLAFCAAYGEIECPQIQRGDVKGNDAVYGYIKSANTPIIIVDHSVAWKTPAQQREVVIHELAHHVCYVQSGIHSNSHTRQFYKCKRTVEDLL